MKPSLHLRFPLDEVPFWAARYAYADDADVERIGAKVRRRGWYNRDEFLAVTRWKTQRTISRCERNDEVSVKGQTQKQVNLLEALGAACPGVTETELGGICNQLATRPHSAVKASIRSLYGFASNYPGIRHAGNPASALRDMEMRDLVAMSILLAGFTPYLSDQLDADVVYQGR